MLREGEKRGAVERDDGEDRQTDRQTGGCVGSATFAATLNGVCRSRRRLSFSFA